MSRILVIEDETELRRNMVRGLAKLDGITIAEAESLDAAIAEIDSAAPELVLSDLNLPGRSGIELLAELDARRLTIPVVFISAYVNAFRDAMPRGRQVEIFEKPMGLHELRELVRRKLEQGRSESAPFGMAEYVQIAAMGGHSVTLAVRRGGRSVGSIEIHRGAVWSARDTIGGGEDAFLRLLVGGGAVQCTVLGGPPRERDVFVASGALLLRAAALSDEQRAGLLAPVDRQRLAGVAEAPAPTPTPTPEPQAPRQPPVSLAPASRTTAIDDGPERSAAFRRACDRGLDALLRRAYPEALDAFLAAESLVSGNKLVVANLERLAELGYRNG
jgi:CheY-like chemotaxis protein